MRLNHFKLHRLWLILLLVGIIAGLATFSAGCGDDDDDDDDNDDDNDDADKEALLEFPVDETIQLEGLSAPVRVAYDEYAVPYIFAENSRDMSMALGYIQAANRFFQLDFFRHVGQGRLTEMLGPSQINSDVYLRAAFMANDGTSVFDKILAEIPDDMMADLQAFSDGINVWLHARQEAGVDDDWPEAYKFALINMGPEEVEDWTPRDTIAFARYQAWDLSETLGMEMSDTNAAAVLSEDLFNLLFSTQPATDTTILPDAKDGTGTQSALPSLAQYKRFLDQDGKFIYADYLKQVLEIEESLAFSTGGMASNNWIVSPDTAGGSGFVANDPHLSLTMPPIWMMGLIDTSILGEDDFRSWGVFFPGTNRIVIGANRNVAWGVTVCGYDVLDVYQEELVLDGETPVAVMFNGEEVDLIESEQTYVLGHGVDPATETRTMYVVPHHGPIAPGSISGTTALSHRWTGAEASNELAAFTGLNEATNVAEAMDLYSAFEVGGQNFVVQDIDGDMAYYPHSNVPKRTGDMAANPPWMILPGDDGVEWDGQLTKEELPQSLNPERGWLATANNDINGSLQDGNPLTGGDYYLHADRAIGYRAQRVHEGLTELAAAKATITTEDMQKLQLDVQSNFARDLVPPSLTALDDDMTGLDADAQSIVALWQNWDFVLSSGLTGFEPTSSASSDQDELDRAVSAMAFAVYEKKLKAAVFGDEITDEGASFGFGSANFGAAIKRLMNDEYDGPLASTIFDDVSTDGSTETKRDCVVAALNATVAELAAMDEFDGLSVDQWLWGRKHHLMLYHLTWGDFDDSFNLGPYAIPGGLYTVNNLGYGGDFITSHGPSMRSVHEIAGGEITSYFHFPGGNSGYEGDPHQDDVLQLWLTGEYYQVPTEVPDILNAAQSMVEFTP